ncbi:polysaccharide lyase family 8 super-sandwich domain-containing protein [Vibrio cionasavignyae]|uniref:polysaccharide lyase family 8 super-sandwich domain-containing protein n=1 Tax=Vibrio cionasavignyae TaxID=2910252 RepID=UPI003D0B57E3
MLQLTVRNIVVVLIAACMTAVPALQASTLETIEIEGDTFEIQVGSAENSVVIGSIGLSKSAVAKDYDYKLLTVDPNNEERYELRTYVDYSGVPRGEFVVAKGQTVKSVGETELAVGVFDADGQLVASRDVTIDEVTQTQWQTYFDRLKEFVLSSKRMWGDRYYSQSEVDSLTKMLRENNGSFTDLSIYKADLSANKSTVNGKEFEEAVNRIGGLGYAYYSESDRDRKELIRVSIVKAFNRLAVIFPHKGFASNKNFTHADRTHQWRFLDALSLPLVYIFEETYQKSQGSDTEATTFLTNVNAYYQIAFDIPESDRDPERLRYFLTEDMSKSPGTWADANRGHRLRSWSVLVGLWRDYNRPITDLEWWYEDYAPFKKLNTSIFPEWTPTGSFSDLKVWGDTNSRRPYKYGQSGYLPDGSLSHHVSHRQDMAMLAYGFEWYAESVFEVAHLLQGTQWAMSATTFEETTEVMLYSYDRLIYKDALDFQAAGRTFLSSNANIFGSKNINKAITHIEDASGDMEFGRSAELTQLQEDLVEQTHSNTSTTAFWNSDMLVHRNDADPKASWYSSFKMQSSRTRGAESFHQAPGMHNGSGVLQIKVLGNEYTDARYNWDWHAIPGITEELKTDGIPMQSEQDAFNPSPFAGTLSDGFTGLASFHYGSENTYTSATAKKSVFYLSEAVVALGSDVARVERDNDSSTYQSIITTIDQPRWFDTITYYTKEQGTDTIDCCIVKDKKVGSSDPAWFHQGRVGYITFPNSGQKQRHLLVTGSGVKDTLPTIGDDPVFLLAVNHTAEPKDDEQFYHYVLVPNAIATEMPAKMAYFEKHLTVINTSNAQGIRFNDDEQDIYQVVFHQAGTVTLGENTITAAQPMLLQMTKLPQGWRITAQNPTAHNKEVVHDEGTKHKFGVTLKAVKNELRVTTSINLHEGTYRYDTQGPTQKFVEGQEVSVASISEGSELLFNLPGNEDEKAYDYRQQLYSGMPAIITVENR